MLERKNIFPDDLSKRIVGGHVLYSPVVTVVPQAAIGARTPRAARRCARYRAPSDICELMITG